MHHSGGMIDREKTGKRGVRLQPVRARQAVYRSRNCIVRPSMVGISYVSPLEGGHDLTNCCFGGVAEQRKLSCLLEVNNR